MGIFLVIVCDSAVIVSKVSILGHTTGVSLPECVNEVMNMGCRACKFMLEHSFILSTLHLAHTFNQKGEVLTSAGSVADRVGLVICAVSYLCCHRCWDSPVVIWVGAEAL